MNAKIKEALKVEQTGNFSEALKQYLKISREDLPTDDKVFLDRSIAACLFYLKQYEQAENKFLQILKNYELDLSTKKEVQTCINLCYLYGGKPETARDRFLESLKSGQCSEEEKCWTYWYLGQCQLNMGDYTKMEEFYQKCVEYAHKLKLQQFPFFTAHLMVSEILNQNYAGFQKSKKMIQGLKDNSFGLLKIAQAIYNRNTGTKDWENLFNQGLKEARESNYIENIQLANFLKDFPAAVQDEAAVKA